MSEIKGFKETLDHMYLIHKQKNDDYAGNTDPYKNFKWCEVLGICSVERGILVRMTDKMSRIVNLLEKENSVKDEAITDTLEDLSNYAVILKCYLEQNKKELSKK